MPLTVPFNAPSEIAFTPVWSNITFINGPNVGKYTLNGKRVDFTAQITFGSTTSMGSGPVLTLPVPAAAPVPGSQIQVWMYDNSAAQAYAGMTNGPASASNTGLLCVGVASTSYTQAGSLAASVPMPWAVNDILAVSGWYMAA